MKKGKIMDDTFEQSIMNKLNTIGKFVCDLNNQIQDMNHAAPTLQEKKERSFINAISKFESLLVNMKDDLESIDVSTMCGEIKYIGNRLNEIEKKLEHISKNGIEKRVLIDVSVDKQKLVPMTVTYDKQDQLYDECLIKKELLSFLQEKEKKIFILRCGFESGKTMTYKDISERVGISKERCGQIFNRAMRRINRPEFGKLILQLDNKEINKHFIF